MTSSLLRPEFSADDELRALILEQEENERLRFPVAPELTRRGFMVLTGLAGGGLALGLALSPRGAAANVDEGAAAAELAPNPFLSVAPDGSVLVYAARPDVGQGVKTAIPMIVAEELDADWSQVRVEQAPIDPQKYGRQSAGGSRSVASDWNRMRQAGATARAMLIAAAAQEWSVPAGELQTEPGRVVHTASGRSASYGELATAAAALPVPSGDSVKLKSPDQYRILGSRVTGVDNLALVTGKPLFGIDQRLEGMRYATYVKCPKVGGKVASANLDEVKGLPGVTDAFVLEGNGNVTEVMPGVAIVATSTWAAFSARKKLVVEWDESEASKDSWEGAVQRATELARQEPAENLRDDGDVDAAFEKAEKTVEGFYSYPFVAHAPLEPQNATAWFHDGQLEIWAPTQTPDRALAQIARLVDLDAGQVTIHQTRGGGGFGRRLINDPIAEAAVIAQKLDAPVKLQWTREDDFEHDFYRVGGFHALKGAVDSEGKLSAWQNHFISFTADGRRPVSGGNMSDSEFPARVIDNYRCGQTLMELATPCGPWRAPRSNSVAFAMHSFIHELAVAAGRDHLEFLLELMGEPRQLEGRGAMHTGRAANVIRRAAREAGWSTEQPEGRGLGLSFYYSHAGHFAEVADVSVDANKKLTVHRIVVACDIGPVVNLSGAENQCQGSVIDGLSTMFHQGLDIANGQVQPNNFDRYPMLRMPSAPPVVDVHFLKSDYPPTGAGEPALPPLAAAITNAIYAATGERIRTLPLRQHGYTI